MEQTLITQLKILKLSNVKPNFAELAQIYDLANIFFQLIAKRYEKNSTIITTNMPFSKWGEFFGSATFANAVLDRLLHHSSIISIKGPS